MQMCALPYLSRNYRSITIDIKHSTAVLNITDVLENFASWISYERFFPLIHAPQPLL
jgi:hypothetical protein